MTNPILKLALVPLSFFCFFQTSAQIQIVNTSDCDFTVKIIKLDDDQQEIASVSTFISSQDFYTGFYVEGYTGIELIEANTSIPSSGFVFSHNPPCCRPNDIENTVYISNYGTCNASLIYKGYGSLEIQ